MKVESVVVFSVIYPKELSIPFSGLVTMSSRGDKYTIEDLAVLRWGDSHKLLNATVTSVTDAVYVAGFVQRCVDGLTDFGMIEEFSIIDVSIRITGGSV